MKAPLKTLLLGVSFLTLLPLGTAAQQAGISKVEPVSIHSPQGTVPRLPYRVKVTYSDGRIEYRQVRWNNAAPATEQQQTQKSRGQQYAIDGFILGDNTTENGYPVQAQITVQGDAYTTPAPQPVAHPLPLTDVTLDGDNRLTSNRDMALREIASWDVSQQLYNYRDTYGLSTEGYTRSDGWDSPDTKLKGHGSGHYMSALALAYAATSDPVQKATLAKNISRMVTELRQCQERTFVYNKKLGRYWEARDFAPEAELREMKGTWEAFDEYKKHPERYGYGYLNAIPAQHPVLIEMYRAYNNSDWVWAPYYTIHKQLAGLIDIATYFDNKEIADKALLIAKDMGLWVWNRMHYRTYVEKEGTQDERRARPGNRYEMWNMYIAGEVGGIGESLARLSEMVSDPTEKARLLEASNCFDSPAMFEPLAVNVDDIRNRHANQHIPMIIAALRSYLSNGDARYYNLSENFWTLLQGRYRYATGGVGNGEMFRQPYTQVQSMVMNGLQEGDAHANPTLNETCCAYNLLKLTRDLNCYRPDDARYMDYYERTLYNQIVGSLNPEHYACTYQYAVGLNATKPFGNETPQSTCCGGTGSENHVKYQEATYFASDHTLWVGLYLPTTLNWKAKGITLKQECLWPAESSKITITEGSADFEMKLRIPYWATEGYSIKLNGKPAAESNGPGSYAVIAKRTWKQGDVIEVTMPFTKHIDFGPDKLSAEMAAKDGAEAKSAWMGTLMYGPLVMTGTDATNYKEATLRIDSRLASITANRPGGTLTGTQGNLYTLTVGNRTFQPDYYRHEHSTHYYRIEQVADPTAELKTALSGKLSLANAFKKEHYTKKSHAPLGNAMLQARLIIETKDVTETQLTEAMQAIDLAIEGLKARGLETTLLTATIGEAESLDEKTYTTISYQELKTTLNSAKEILQKAEAKDGRKAEAKDGRKADDKQQTQQAVDRQTYALQQAVKALVKAEAVDKSQLNEFIQMAAERRQAQQAWEALEVKVPEFAPWARHGYGRLMEVLAQAEAVSANKGRNFAQSEVNSAAGELSSAINSMRPGHLPEMEDLRPLSGLLRRAGRITDATTPELKSAIEYGEMVVKYVADGSGTFDMIENAIKRLKSAQAN